MENINIYKTKKMKKYLDNEIDYQKEYTGIGICKHILLCGSTGSGKSNALVNSLLLTSKPKLGTFIHIFLCYNRKPREHRVNLVKKLIDHNLKKHGVITLGENRKIYSKTDKNKLHLSLNEDMSQYSTWTNQIDTFGDIPDDLHSLGNLIIWQNHFLTVVSETEFLPWDNTYVSEKTWKPIIGLRPFLINGQSKIYKWLRDRGFKTFNHYFNGI